MKEFGLLGRNLSHSYSPQIHKYFYDYKYLLYEVEPNQLNDFMLENKLDGMNVTIPYKKDVIPFCNSLSDIAKKIGAVNTIVREKDNSLSGYNTDYYGFSYMLNSAGVDVTGKKAIVLGSGGASLTCQTVLRDLNAKSITVISRSGKDNYSNLSNHYDAEVIVNTTPVGMFPNTDNSPIDLSNFKSCEAVLDLIYNPKKTMLLKQAENLRIANANGILMLIAQAKQSAELFLGNKIDESVIEKIAKEFEI